MASPPNITTCEFFKESVWLVFIISRQQSDSACKTCFSQQHFRVGLKPIQNTLKMIVRKRVALLAVLGFLCQSCQAMLQLQVDITKAVVCSDQAEEGDKVGTSLCKCNLSRALKRTLYQSWTMMNVKRIYGNLIAFI